MKVWKCRQVVDFDKPTTTDKEERNRTLQRQMTDKYHHFLVRLHLNTGNAQLNVLKLFLVNRKKKINYVYRTFYMSVGAKYWRNS